MFKHISALALAAQAVETVPRVILDALFLNEPVEFTQMKEQKLAGFGNVPCQYIYDNAWYNLVDMSNVSTPGYYQSEGAADTKVAYYNFCQSLSSTEAPCHGDYYAAYESVTGECTAASTDNLDSVS